MDRLDAIFIKNIDNFEIYKTRNKYYKRQYIIWNTDIPFENGHTHVITLEQCEYIIHNVLTATVPYRKCTWRVFNDIIMSHIRITDDERYINHMLNIVNHKFQNKNYKVYMGRRFTDEQIS